MCNATVRQNLFPQCGKQRHFLLQKQLLWELSNDSFEHTLNEVRAVTADSSLFSVALFIESKLSLSPPLIESKLSTVAKKVKIAS